MKEKERYYVAKELNEVVDFRLKQLKGEENADKNI